MPQKVYYGGQAVMEGVMMRGRKTLVTAVRNPRGEIVTDTRQLSSLYSGWARRTPFIRGVIVMIESLVLGIKSLFYSANVSLEEEGEKVSSGMIWVIMIIALSLVVVVFYIVPLLLTRLLNIESSLLFNLVDGFIRIAIFVIYLWVMGFMRDIRLSFAYHGAEHKTINTYESGDPLEVESVRRHSTAHVRCGTSFLFVVLIIAVLVFTIFGIRNVWLMVLSRIVLIPVIAAISYEIIYFAGRHSNNIIARIISKPGLWLQSLTTRQPTDKQIEVALAALKSVIAADREDEPAPVSLSDTPPSGAESHLPS